MLKPVGENSSKPGVARGGAAPKNVFLVFKKKILGADRVTGPLL